MLGGLLMGGLIGSLLFGSGQVGGGIGLFDILLIGGGLFLLMRFLRTRRMATQTPGGGGALPFDSGSGNAWGSDNYTAYAKPGSPAVAAPVYPKGFDADDFLRGANQIYIRLQSSWDRRDLEDIRQFAADDVYEEIRRQAKEDPHPSKTELLRIEPRILEVRDVQGQIVVSVLYDCMLRENEKEMARQVRELWHFSRQAGDTKSFWLLEGIQQVEL
jgi:predicted lipid-binding transport protein (Tim44 family)